jgi:hypothetical protein
MILKPQDIYVLAKLISLNGQKWTYAGLAKILAMSQSEINAGVKRAIQAGLIAPATSRNDPPRPIRLALMEFLSHGIRYAFPADRGEITRGIPTAYAAPPLKRLVVTGKDPVPVWPSALGNSRGYAFSPLYRSVPKAALADMKLYEILALVDAVRGGRARDRSIAIGELKKRIDLT